MLSRLALAVIGVAVIGVAATLGALPGAAAPAPAIAYTMKTVEWHDPACRPSPSDRFSCSHILFKYPVIERAPNPAAAAALNRAVRDFVLTSAGEPRKFPSLEAATRDFMDGYEEYRHQTPMSGTYWEERTVAVRYQSPAIVSLEFDRSFFFGGLHPQYTALFTSFDATTGARMTLDDVLVAGYRPRLTRIAENEFRAQRGIKPGMTLRDAGYIFFKNDTFALSDNFWLGPKGATFFYNDYDIAPYSMGTTELLITYREIRDLIKPDGLLASMR